MENSPALSLYLLIFGTGKNCLALTPYNVFGGVEKMSAVPAMPAPSPSAIDFAA